eukprot:1774826-Pyramimonas_sp.AAC.1
MRPKRPLRGLKDNPRARREVLQEGPKRPKSFIFLTCLFYVCLFGLQTAQDGPRGPQDRLKIAHEASKMTP